MPERIQLRRTKGWRKPTGAITVARPSKWGNLYVVGTEVQVSGWTADGLGFDLGGVKLNADMAVQLYEREMEYRLRFPEWPDPAEEDVAYIQGWVDALEELRGHDLACWCPLDAPCHADVLLRLANRRRAA